MRNDNPPSISSLIIFIGLVALVGGKLAEMQVNSGHCVPNWNAGLSESDCYLFDDDRLNAALAFAAAAASAGALIWLRRQGEVDGRLQRLLKILIVLGSLIGVWVFFSR